MGTRYLKLNSQKLSEIIYHQLEKLGYEEHKRTKNAITFIRRPARIKIYVRPDIYTGYARIWYLTNDVPTGRMMRFLFESLERIY
ncbi:MAG: hypothetical protein M1371_03810 [Actinobacteria bacterium]|nr:hypothetical protein [Actinomycetota bacterium]